MRTVRVYGQDDASIYFQFLLFPVIIAVDESGNPSDENPYVLGISVILKEKYYAEIPEKLFGRFKVLKYSESLPKASRLEGPNAKGIFIEFLSNYVTSIGIIIEKFEQIKGEGNSGLHC